MFKKFKDKLAEEVKSSPQRIQQFAQAAQAAVTSASSSISDITNNDLFSIGDSDNTTKPQLPVGNQLNMPQNINQTGQNTSDLADFSIDFEDRQRHRRLSNSSFASDISFRLPNYETPSMYHLQSDMEVSASEAEEKGFVGGNVNLDRVTKEQLYAAYRRTQDRCKKYKTQYSDLARHYKLLERENAKARNVLVETQDKALRRISELKEQCSLEQSAKAHLEKALRIELEEKGMKIDALNTQLNLLQSNHSVQTDINNENTQMQLINLNDENDSHEKELPQTSEISILNTKIEKMEQLLSKYKESLKTTKEKNSNLTSEVQKLNLDLEGKTKEIIELQQNVDKLAESKEQIKELLEKIEYLENLNNTLEFSKNKELSILESNLQNSQDEISELQKKIKILSKREEEYAISLAENKLSIHKELESKEAEIKSLKHSLSSSQTEIESLNKVIKDNKNEISKLEGECKKLNDDLRDLSAIKIKLEELTKEHENLNEKRKLFENTKSKFEEDINCINLQLKQETAEKLSVIDRNIYLEGRNTQLTDENTKKRSQINKLEDEVLLLKNNLGDLKNALVKQENDDAEASIIRLTEEANVWKSKCSSLESEIQEERVELVKLQAEIEKLLCNHESLQEQNIELNATVKKLQVEKVILNKELEKYKSIRSNLAHLKKTLVDIRQNIVFTSTATKTLNDQVINHWLPELKENIVKNSTIFLQEFNNLQQDQISMKDQISKITNDYEDLSENTNKMKKENVTLKEEIKQKDTVLATLSSETETTISSLKEQCVGLEKENKVLCEKLQLLDENNVRLMEDLKKSNELYQSSMKKVDTLVEEGTAALTIKDEHEKQVQYINELQISLNNIKQQNTELTSLNLGLEEKHKTLMSELLDLRTSYSKLKNDIQVLELENQNMKSEQQEIQSKYKQLESQLQELSNTNQKMAIDIESLNGVNNNLSLIKTETEDKYKLIETELQESQRDYESRLQGLSHENGVLKSTHEETVKKFKVVESELIETRNALIEIEKEKKYLELKVKELEGTISSQIKIIEDEENANLLKHKATECESLKEDNRRLCSDIEGLQTYLSKISKENGELNDKLRELFASSDNNSNGNDQLRTEIQIGKDKIEELLRENSLLVEENLELKDQIQSQLNSTQPFDIKAKSNSNHDIDLKVVNEKYQHLLETKNSLELKVNELEQMNTSLNKNMDQNQNNYERLKLSNEKLQRKLDEALVSLRHLHALEENTELEYLRNILYEYLTGSGTHSITLAKVLAAVVKFDDRQTEQVLIKEKERQGLLHQLGII